MVVCWLDPGLLTGVTVYDTYVEDFLYCDEHDLKMTGEFLEASGEITSVGWETYTIMKGPQTQAPWSLEVIGMAKYLCIKHGYTMLNPQAPKVREVITDTMLRDLNLYAMIKGKKDAKSSLQHCLAWLLLTNRLPERWHQHVYGKLL